MHVAKSEKRRRKYIFRDSWRELYEKIEKQPPELFYKNVSLNIRMKALAPESLLKIIILGSFTNFSKTAYVCRFTKK